VPAAPKDASDLVLQEIERVVDEQLDNFKSLTSRAGTVLSVLIGSLTATLAVSGVIARPPLWAVAIPSIPLVAAVVVSCLVFFGSEVATGPKPETLLDRMGDSEHELQKELAEFYAKVDAGEPPSGADPGFVGNRYLLHRKQRLFEVSVVLLALTVAALVAVALALYWP